MDLYLLCSPEELSRSKAYLSISFCHFWTPSQNLSRQSSLVCFLLDLVFLVTPLSPTPYTFTMCFSPCLQNEHPVLLALESLPQFEA